MSQPGPMGWGLPNVSESELYYLEKQAFEKLANIAPQHLMRHAEREPKNTELLKRVEDRVKSAGWDDGMILPFLFHEVTKIQPNWLRQLIGSCVASGDMRTTAYRMVAEVFVFHDPEELPGTQFSGTDSLAFYAPFSYRAGRKLAGINGNSDGSLCLPHIRGKMQFGHLPCNASGLQSDAFPEPQSEATYKRWGANDTLLNQFASQAASFKLLESEPVKSVNDIHTLICQHLKPANICSMWGFKTTGKSLGKDPTGKTIRQWSRSGQWAHNMSVVGHVSKSGTDYVIIENSWGGYHDGSTCFAVEASEMDRWLKQAECQSVGEIDLNDSGPAVDWGSV
jgi:hypothetical protein